MGKILNKKAISFFVLLLVVGGSLAAAGYFYYQYQKVKKDPNLIATEEVKLVTGSIKRFMELPNDEDPTLATVTDQAKLKDQDFFKNSLNGDKVLIYTKAHKAILYRPSTNRVIEFAPLTFGAESQASQSGVQAQPVKVAIYNGTKVIGLSNEYANKLAGVSSLSVVSKTNAVKSDYTKTMVFNLSGNNQALVTQVAQLVGGEIVDKLPDGETKPQADILIIAGK